MALRAYSSMQIESTITIAAIATATSAAVSAVVSVVIARINQRWSETRKLDELLQQINILTIQHPHVESTAFISRYSHSTRAPSDKMLQYEAYCIIVFNYLEKLGRFHGFDQTKMQKDVHVPEMILPHRAWWFRHLAHNRNAYARNFITIVQNLYQGVEE